MPEETTAVAEPSSAPVAVEETPLEIPRSGPEYTKWRTDGTLPDKAKPKDAEPAPADTSKETLTDAPDSDPGNKQQESRRKPGAEARISELTARTKQLERELEEARKPKAEPVKQAESKPEPPQTYADYRKTFKAQEWVTKFSEANPEASYEEAQAALVDHLADARDYFRGIETAKLTQEREFNGKVEEARSRYENFDDVVSPTATAINSDPQIFSVVKQMLSDSEVLPDVLFTIGGDKQALADFIKMAKETPGKALRYIAKVESLIEAQLAKPRNDKGQFAGTEAEEAPKAPAKRGPETAPAPPLEIGSRGSGVMDESERALQAVERGDGNAMRTWMEAQNRKDIARRNGA